MSTSRNLNKIFSEEIDNLPKDLIQTQSQERGVRKMRLRLWEKFDEVWVRYNNNQATYQEWKKALDKWLNVEKI
tara:strand:+ start:322 stop:543 length:222 start_codon:yes stop_codon:yes gene_type:complete